MEGVIKRILVTGATGKVGSHFIGRVLDDCRDVTIRALCHNRRPESRERLEIVRALFLSSSPPPRSPVTHSFQPLTFSGKVAGCSSQPDKIEIETLKAPRSPAEPSVSSLSTLLQ